MNTASNRAPNLWRTASDESRIWSALSPIRMVWLAAERRIARATTPRAMSDRDRSVERLLASSAVVHAIQALIDACVNAWNQSATATGLRAADATLGRAAATRVRRVGWIMMIASATAAGLQRWASTPAPLMWIVPAVFMLVGLIVVVCAPAVARACEHR